MYDLKQFLGCISLFKDPEIDFSEHFATIKSGDTQIKFEYASPKLVTQPKEKVKEIPFVVEFDLSHRVLAAVTQAAKVMGLPVISFVGKDGKLTVVAKDPKSDSTNSYVISLGTTTQTFNFDFDAANFRMLENDYKVKLAKAKIACFESAEVTYYLTTESTSNFNG